MTLMFAVWDIMVNNTPHETAASTDHIKRVHEGLERSEQGIISSDSLSISLNLSAWMRRDKILEHLDIQSYVWLFLAKGVSIIVRRHSDNWLQLGSSPWDFLSHRNYPDYSVFVLQTRHEFCSILVSSVDILRKHCMWLNVADVTFIKVFLKLDAVDVYFKGGLRMHSSD